MRHSETEIEERRAIAQRLFDALRAQFPNNYIALLQPDSGTQVGHPFLTTQNNKHPVGAAGQWLRRLQVRQR
jgi:hypothetical protein